jgi:hypothetical protein
VIATLWEFLAMVRGPFIDDFLIKHFKLPIVPRKAVVEVSGVGHYRSGKLL